MWQQSQRLHTLCNGGFIDGLDPSRSGPFLGTVCSKVVPISYAIGNESMSEPTMVEVMSLENKEIPREFLLKQIENEIKAGFAFVAEARNAYKRSQPKEGDGALAQAAATHEHLNDEVSASPLAQVRMVTHQLSELRAAIDWLRETNFNQTKQS